MSLSQRCNLISNRNVSNYLQSERAIIEDLLKKIMNSDQDPSSSSSNQNLQTSDFQADGDSSTIVAKYMKLEQEVQSLRLKLRESLDNKATESGCTLCANMKVEIEELKSQHTSETQSLLAKMKEKFESMKSMLKEISEERDRLLENASEMIRIKRQLISE